MLSMMGMKNPPKGLHEIISQVDDSWNVFQDDITLILPILNGKVLDVNTLGAFCQDTCIDHLDSRHIVFVHDGQTILRKTNSNIMA
jgi:hypothetical protein